MPKQMKVSCPVSESSLGSILGPRFQRASLIFTSLLWVAPLALGLSKAHALSNKELKIGMSQEFDSLNPLPMSMVASVYIYGFVGRSLVVLDHDGKWIPQLAKSIPTLENKGAELITINGKKTIRATWEILEDAKWSDGAPVVCADFKLSRQIADSPMVSVGSKEIYTQVEDISWPSENPKKCVFTYAKARWDFNQLGTFYPLPSHVEADIFAKFGKQKEGYEKNSNYNKNPTRKGLYNGPFQITDVKLGSHVTLEPNPHFYGTAPKIQKIVLKLIPNTSTLEANLRSGTIDMISPLGLTFDQALAFEKKVKTEKLNYQVLFQPSLVYEHIDLNLDNPILKDRKVREALIQGVNRQDLVKALFEGKQPMAVHSIANVDPWFTDDPKKITLYPYSKRTASRLLDEAGWKMQKDGFRYKDGQKLQLQIMSTAGNKIRETVQAYLQNQWKAIGVDLTIKNEPARVFFGETTKKRQFGAMAMYAWLSAPESTPRGNFHSTQIPSEKNGWSGNNNMGWKNPEVDRLIDELETEFNSKKRIDLAHGILKHYTKDIPVIPLYYRADIAVVPTQLKNFKLTGHLYSESNWAENWTLE